MAVVNIQRGYDYNSRTQSAIDSRTELYNNLRSTRLPCSKFTCDDGDGPIFQSISFRVDMFRNIRIGSAAASDLGRSG